MSVKVYIKKGQKNYKENKLINKLSQAIERKIQENPEFANEYKPATNFAELQQQYDTYCIENVEFTEIKDKDEDKTTYEKHQDFRDSMKEQIEKQEKPKEFEDNDSFIDPLNREEPIVRDYVTDNEFPNDTQTETKTLGRTSFDEPKSFRDSFEMPTEDGKPGETKQSKPKQNKPQSDPVNPNWDDMGNSKKKKSTRKFAKYIVETTCMLAEKGFVWYANKDINDAKLAEYELNNEMDLDLLVTLEDGQEATVRQFFQIQCMKAEQLSKIDPEEKSDLADALAEVLLEKGVGPTPTQELLLISLKIFGGQFATLLMLKTQTNSLLNELRARKQEEIEQGYTPRPKPAQPKPQPVIEQVEQEEEVQNVVNNEPQEVAFDELKEGNFTLLEQIENTEETKE